MPSQGVFDNAARDKAGNPFVIVVSSGLEDLSPEKVYEPLTFNAVYSPECDAELSEECFLQQTPIVLNLRVEVRVPS